MRSIFQILLFISVSFFSQQLNAQTVKWGSEAKDKESNYFSFLKFKDGQTIGLEYENSSYLSLISDVSLIIFDQDFNQIINKKLENLEMYSSGTTKGVIYDDQLIILSLKFKYSSKGMSLLKFVYDLKGNFISKDIITTDQEINFNINRTDIFTISSPNNEKISLTIFEKNLKENTLSAFIYDFDLKRNQLTEAKNKFLIDKEFINFNLEEYIITNEGNKAILISGKLDLYNPLYKDAIITLNSRNELLMKQVFSIDKYDLKNTDFEMSSSGQIYFSGNICTTEKSKQKVNGFFYAKLSNDLSEIENISPFFFTREFFENLAYKVSSKGSISYLGVFLTRLELFEGEGGYLIASHESNGKSMELIVYKFDENNNIYDPVIIPRNIMGAVPKHYDYLDYFSFIRLGKLHLIYSDNIRNLETDRRDETSSTTLKSRGTGTVMATVSKEGKLNRKILFEKGKSKSYLNSNKCYSDQEEVLISVTDGKVNQTGRLFFD